MMTVNLIPAHRIQARRMRIRIRAWAAITLAVAIALLGGHVWLRATWQDDSAELQIAIAQADAEIKSLEQVSAGMRAEIMEAEATLRARRAVGDQPDWGLLLAMLAARLGDQGVLRGCTLEPHGDERNASGRRGSQASNLIRPSRYSLSLTGLTRTQDAASSVAIALEGSGIFERVTLLEARRAAFLGDEAVSFRLECALIDPAAEVP